MVAGIIFACYLKNEAMKNGKSHAVKAMGWVLLPLLFSAQPAAMRVPDDEAAIRALEDKFVAAFNGGGH
jgi:hypothetical protein